MRSKEFVEQNFTQTLPPGVPLPFAVKSSRYKVRGANIERAEAEVVMWDGEPARLSITCNWGRVEYRWLELGNDCAFEGEKWQRVAS